jgi:hypothetical protein
MVLFLNSVSVRFMGESISKGWSFSDLAQLLQRLGLFFPADHYRIDHGSTEDGDPWFSVDDLDEDQVIFQIMRIDSRYGVALDAYRELKFTDTIDDAIDAALGLSMGLLGGMPKTLEELPIAFEH